MKKDIKPWSMIYVVSSSGTRESVYPLNRVHNFLQDLAYLKGVHCVWINKFQLSEIEGFERLQSDLYKRTDLLYLRAQGTPRISRMEFHKIVDAALPNYYGADICVAKVHLHAHKLFPQYPWADNMW